MDQWKQGDTFSGRYNPQQQQPSHQSRFCQVIAEPNEKTTNRDLFMKNKTLPLQQERTTNYEYYQQQAWAEREEKNQLEQKSQPRSIYQLIIEGGTSNQKQRKQIFNNETRFLPQNQISSFNPANPIQNDIPLINKLAEPLIQQPNSSGLGEIKGHKSQNSYRLSEEEQQKILAAQPKTSLVVRNSITPGSYPKDVSIVKFKPIFEEKQSSQIQSSSLVQSQTQQRIIENTPSNLVNLNKQETQLSTQQKSSDYTLIRFEDDVSQIVQPKKASRRIEKPYEQFQVMKSEDQNQIDQFKANPSETLIENSINQRYFSEMNATQQKKQIFDCEQQVQKVSNYVTTNIQQAGEYTMNNQKSGPFHTNVLNEVDVLQEMNSIRQQRVHGLEVPYFSSLIMLEQSECMSDLKAQELKQLIMTQFPVKYQLIRKVRGDGNCLFSSLLFPYLECIYINKEFDSVLDNLVIHDIYWQGKILIDKLVAQTQIKTIFQQLQQLSKRSNMTLMIYSEVVLHYMNNVNGFYDLMVIFIRSLILESFNQYSKSDSYSIFLDEENIEDYQNRIKTFEEEGELTFVCYFTEKTQINVKIIKFEDANPLKNMQIIEPKINKDTQQKKKDSFITLKYNQGHYDIVYSRMMKQIQMIEITNIKEYFINFSGLY